MKPEKAVSTIKNIILTDTNISNSEKEQLLAYLNSIESESSKSKIFKYIFTLKELAELADLLISFFSDS